MRNFLLIGSVAALLSACGTSVTPDSNTTSQDSDTIVIATSFYPLTHVAEQVGGDLVEVRQVAAQGSDPHTYEPTPSQMKQIFESDVFIYNGAGQDTYAERIHDELEDDVIVLVATELVERMAYEEEEHDDHEDHDDHEEHHDHEDEHDDHEGHDDHEHGEWDPHVWLDPQRVQVIVDAIASELSAIDPSRAKQFGANARAYVSELRDLDKDMHTGLSNCALDGVIVSHDAFRYLANRYDFHTHEIAGLSPSAKPSPARLAELTHIAEDEGIRHVFFETQVSSALSNTLANEIGAETLVLHSIEALTKSERAAGMTYIDLMRQNLANLRTALQCS